jgi:hypothetical protein
MTSPQRYWLSGFLLVFSFVLAVYHVEWARYENAPPSYAKNPRLIFTFSEELPTAPWLEAAGTPPSPGSITGIYARTDNVTEAAIFGIFLPLVLIGASGFIALGKRRAKQ